MKFAKSALSLLLLSRATSAWTTAAARGPSGARNLLATQLFHSAATDSSSYSTAVVGEEKTESFRLAFKEGNSKISPWHDIPLKNADGSYNMVRACFVVYCCCCSLVCEVHNNCLYMSYFEIEVHTL